jgi:hypothetical protein
MAATRTFINPYVLRADIRENHLKIGCIVEKKISLACFWRSKKQLGQDRLFGALQTLARGRTVTRAGFPERFAGFTANPPRVSPAIFVALGSETGMENNRYRYQA